MKRSLQFLVLTMLISVLALTGNANDQPTGFRADLIGQIDHVQKQIIDLQNAIPDKKIAWKPAKGVRSIGQVYMHIVFANYLLAKFAGVELPADVTLPDFKDFDKAEAAVTSKKEIAEKLEKSFAFLKSAIMNMKDEDLEKPVTFFGTETNVRGMLLTAFAHQHEHLGQSIAYARMNGIVPPWTVAQQAGGN